MKWIMILALWNTDVPEDSFRFYTQTYASETSCIAAIRSVYAEATSLGIRAQGVCFSERDLGINSITI
jgi:hypothetical protein